VGEDLNGGPTEMNQIITYIFHWVDPNHPKVTIIHLPNALRQCTHKQADALLANTNGIGEHYGDIIANN
jgi:hypothetical protein